MVKDISSKEKTIKTEFLLAQKELDKKKIKKKIDYESFLIGYNRAISFMIIKKLGGYK